MTTDAVGVRNQNSVRRKVMSTQTQLFSAARISRPASANARIGNWPDPMQARIGWWPNATNARIGNWPDPMNGAGSAARR
jgi:hypothetical protein